MFMMMLYGKINLSRMQGLSRTDWRELNVCNTSFGWLKSHASALQNVTVNYSHESGESGFERSEC